MVMPQKLKTAMLSTLPTTTEQWQFCTALQLVRLGLQLAMRYRASVLRDVGKRVCFCPRIDPLRFLAGCRRRRLNQGLVVALDFLSVLVLDRACILC